jgi:hypothetical protein
MRVSFDESIRQAAQQYVRDPQGYNLSGYEGRLCMLKFFGDESAGRNVSGYYGCYIVAGYLADSEVWRELWRDWQIALDAHPKIKYFRMNDCFDLSGPFEGFTAEAANEKLDKLIAVLETYGHAMGWVESTITWDIFNHALNDEEKAFFKSPYYFCASSVINACRHLLGDQRAPVDYTFDNQDGLDLVIHQAVKLIMEELPPEETWLIHKVSFADDRVVLPLQCADLLAWNVRRKYIQLPEDHGRVRPEYTRLKAAIEKRRVRGYWQEEELRASALSRTDPPVLSKSDPGILS